MTDKEKKEEPKLIAEVDEAVELKKEVEKLKKERDEYLGGWKRAKADLINYKRDERQRLEEIVKFSNEALILDLISILDDFDLALAALEKKRPVEKGVHLIKSRLEDFLKRRGLTRIEVKAGEKFNPAFHEAIVAVEAMPASADSASVATLASPEPSAERGSAEEAATVGKEGETDKSGTIVEEIEAGYLLHGKVIRPARVKVYK